MITDNKKLIKSIGIVAMAIFILFISICITVATISRDYGEKISQVEDENMSLRHQISYASKETVTIRIYEKLEEKDNDSNYIDDSDYVYIHKKDLEELERKYLNNRNSSSKSENNSTKINTSGSMIHNTTTKYNTTTTHETTKHKVTQRPSTTTNVTTTEIVISTTSFTEKETNATNNIEKSETIDCNTTN